MSAQKEDFALRLSVYLSFQSEVDEEGQMLSLTKILCYHKSELKYILNIINKKVSKYEMILNKVTRVCSRVEVPIRMEREVVSRQL